MAIFERSAPACPINNIAAVMLAGPAISGIASGKTADFITQLGLLLFTDGEGRETARAREDQLDRLQQEEDARGYFESGHADLQELQNLRPADREDDETSAAYGNRLKRQPRSHSATGSRRQRSEDRCGLERADR